MGCVVGDMGLVVWDRACVVGDMGVFSRGEGLCGRRKVSVVGVRGV